MHQPYVYPGPDAIDHPPNAFDWRYLRLSAASRDASSAAVDAFSEAEPLSAKMQVAVAIAMPRPAPPAYLEEPGTQANASSRPRRETEIVSEFCLGMAQVQGVGGDEWRDLHSTPQPLRLPKELDE
jgi:hypothetical protein